MCQEAGKVLTSTVLLGLCQLSQGTHTGFLPTLKQSFLNSGQLLTFGAQSFLDGGTVLGIVRWQQLPWPVAIDTSSTIP
jgi:hypothetical protein